MTGVDLVKFKQLLIEKGGVDFNSSLIVGVSGGPDSVCLLDLLHKCGLQIIVAHYNHHLRESADAECEFVRKFALKQGLEFISGEGNIKQFAVKKNVSVEEAARLLRYSFLFEQADKYGAPLVAIAHTADDQVETILMHILRGCSLDGLQGMQFIGHTMFHPFKKLIRPLISFWRDQILKYCQENKLEYVVDESNLELIYLRNRIRNELLPMLEKYNPMIKQHIFQLGETVKSDVAFLHMKTKGELESRLREEHPGRIELDISDFHSLPLSLQKRILFMCLQKISGRSMEVDFKQVEDVLTFIEYPTRSKFKHLFENISIKIKNHALQFSNSLYLDDISEYPYCNAGISTSIGLNDRVLISEKWMIESRLVKKDDVRYSFQPDGKKSIAFLDADLIKGVMLVRCTTPGDKYQPLGMDAKGIKISDFFTNKKIPQAVRSLWPLVFYQDDVVWIPGFSPSHIYRITEKTTEVIELKLIKKSADNY